MCNLPERKFVLAEAGNELVPEIHATLFSFYSCYVNRWFLCNFSHHLKKLWTFSLFPFDQKKVVLIIRKLKDHILLLAKFSTESGVNYQISLHFRSARTSQSNISSLSSALPSLRAKNLNQCKLVLNHYRPGRTGTDRTGPDQTRPDFNLADLTLELAFLFWFIKWISFLTFGLGNIWKQGLIFVFWTHCKICQCKKFCFQERPKLEDGSELWSTPESICKILPKSEEKIKSYVPKLETKIAQKTLFNQIWKKIPREPDRKFHLE